MNGKSGPIEQRWEGIASALGVLVLGALAIAMVVYGYECATLYPVVAVVAGIAGYTVNWYRREP